MRIFDLFKMAATSVLDFQNIDILTLKRVKYVNVHHNAKFPDDWSKRCWDMAIFRFFKMAAAAYLDFQNLNFLTVRRVEGVNVYHSAKFRDDRVNHC